LGMRLATHANEHAGPPAEAHPGTSLRFPRYGDLGERGSERIGVQGGELLVDV
jgi:hypothetical protein